MTLREHLNELSNEEFAELIIKVQAEESYDYNWEEELVFDGIEYSYRTTDGNEYFYKSDALEHQLELLERECYED